MTEQTQPVQPEALRLAECLERDCHMNWPDYDNQMNAAAELRRLHAENEQLKAQLAQRERPALTDEQIKDVVWGYVQDSNNIDEHIIGIVRATEAAHGVGDPT